VDPKVGLDASEETKISFPYRDSNPGHETGYAITALVTLYIPHSLLRIFCLRYSDIVHRLLRMKND
jgi:hypothetical protein